MELHKNYWSGLCPAAHGDWLDDDGTKTSTII